MEVGEPVTGEGPGKAETLLKDVLKSNFVLFSCFFGSPFPGPSVFRCSGRFALTTSGCSRDDYAMQ